MEAAGLGGLNAFNFLVRKAFTKAVNRLEVRLPTGCHVLTLPELFKEIVPEESELKLRLKTKRAALIMKKREPGAAWPKLAAV